jgi:hypothetical protein
LSEDNVCVLDRPTFRIDGGARRTADDILKVDYAVRDALGIPRRGGQMVQPWARQRSEDPKRATVELLYDFGVDTMPSGPVRLGLEVPESFCVELNGEALNTDAECGWWCDLSLRTIPVPIGMLRPGTNQLRLVCDYTEDHPGLEIVYLLGDFGVRLGVDGCTLVAPVDQLRAGDWVEQGLPFYSGHVAYDAEIKTTLEKGERAFVCIPDYRGVAVRVHVDGQPAGIIAWEPNAVDITEFLGGAGSHTLSIEVIGHRRNSHGPLHCSEKWPVWTGSGEFTTSGDHWCEDYQLVPCGVMKAPRIEIRR